MVQRVYVPFEWHIRELADFILEKLDSLLALESFLPLPTPERGKMWGHPTPRQGAAVPGPPDPVPLGTLLYVNRGDRCSFKNALSDS